MGRVWRGNLRKISALVGVEDAHAAMVARTIAVHTATAAPTQRGAQPFMAGLAGAGVNAAEVMSVSPLQRFKGIDVHQVQSGARRATGDITANDFSGTAAEFGSAAWLDLGKIASVGWG